MAKNQKPIEKDDVIFINMEVVQLPQYPIDYRNDIISWGKKNDFPSELIKLRKSHPIHGYIIKGKTRYLAGQSIKPEIENPAVLNFLNNANEKDSWHQLSKKFYSDKVTYGGAMIMVTTNIAGQPMAFYHMEMSKCRVSQCGTGIWYSNDWAKKNNVKEKTFYPFYKEGYAGTQVIYYKDYNSSVNDTDNVYPEPEYTCVLLDISTDVEISKYFNSLVRNGFSAGHIITFFSGEMKPEVKADIKARFQEQHQGPDNAGKVVLAFAGKDGKGAEIVSVDPNNLDKQYKELNDRNQQNIVSGHGYSFVLAKIQVEGKLGDRSEIDLAQELLISEYAKPEQKSFNDIVQKFCKIRTGIDTVFTTEQFTAINRELPLDNQNIINALNAKDPNIVTNYIIDYYGVKVPEGAEDLPAPVKAQMENMANEHLKNLTAYQRNGMLSIVKKFKDGKMNEAQAMIMIKGFGISDSDARAFLGLTLSNQFVETKLSEVTKEEIFLSWVESNTIEIDENDELISTEYVTFSDRDEVVKFELSKQIEVKMKDDLQGGKRKAGLSDFIRSLVSKPKRDASLPPTDDGFENRVYTVYRYGLRKELEGQLILIPTSHEFCKRMVHATEGNKRLTFEKIDSMENDFGDNAWDFRGGFWGKQHTCRHIWIAETRIKKNKK